MATAAGSIEGHSSRFAAACGVLSRYVKEAAVRAAAVEAEARPAAAPVALPLMPGADVSTTTQEEHEASCAAGAQLSIFYGGRVVVVDDVTADRAAELLRLAASCAASAKGVPRHDLPMANKASLQRFMEKRRGRVAARAAPYLRPDGASACPWHLKLAL